MWDCRIGVRRGCLRGERGRTTHAGICEACGPVWAVARLAMQIRATREMERREVAMVMG